jgi:hypothetical protein
MQNAGSIKCNRCGTPATAGRKFCRKCGGPLTSQATAVTPRARQKPTPPPTKPSAAKTLSSAKAGLSSWWIIGPTILFAYLSRNPIAIAVVAAIGAALWIARNKDIAPTADKNIRALQPYLPFAPAFQVVVVFVMLGGNLIITAMIIAAVVAAVRYWKPIVFALEPWWNFQASIPPGARKPLAFLVAGFIGYYFGKRAGGQEWTYTLISIFFGMAIAFLIVFTPPDSARKAKSS